MSEGGERILIADDSRFIRKLLQGTLAKEGYQVIEACDGRQAVDMATGDQRPHLIVLDVQMPELDGFEVCDELVKHEETQGIPIIFLTAQPETEHRVRGMALAHVDYMPKPFKAPELLTRIRVKLRMVSRETIRREKLAVLTEELERAQKTQQGLLPEDQLLPGLEVIGKMQAARHVGGDYYDFFGQGQQAIICIGDVSGKGIPAAMVMVMTRTFLHSQDIHAQTPMEILRAVNKMLHGGTDPGVFMSLLLMKWDAERGVLSVCGAGHEHFLIHRSMMGEMETVASGGSVLGLREQLEGDFLEMDLELAPGDTVLLYTDGVTEARNAQGEEFGLGRLEGAFERHIIGSTKSVVEAVFDEVLEFVDGAEQHDDITLVGLRRESGEEFVL